MGAQELLIVLAILLLLFGAKKLPGLAGSLGTSIKEFRKATDDAAAGEDDVKDGDHLKDGKHVRGGKDVEDVRDRDRTVGEGNPIDRDAER